MKTLRLALGQLNCTVGDIDGNSEKIIRFIDRSREKGAHIVVFPEMTITGYPPEDLLFKKRFIKDNLSALEMIASKCHGITAVMGFADRKGEDLYNAAALINNCAVKGIYHKIILPNYGVFDEKRYFRGGEKCPVFELDGLRFGVNICEDIWHSSGPAMRLAREGGAKLILNLNASPFHAGKQKERERILSERVRESGVMIAYTNLVGGQDELVFDGGSLIMDEKGKLIARAPHFEETLLIADVLVESTPTSFSRQEIIPLEGEIEDNRIAEKGYLASGKEEVDEIYGALVLGVSDYVRKNGFKGVIIGLSGGIDSALTAAIAVKAIGADRVTGVAMPSPYSSQGSIDDAQALAGNLGIEFHTIAIGPLFETFKSSLERVFEGLSEDVTEENIQARIRGNLLMSLSNKFGKMVLTTGNKSEVSVGYATLYGDMAGGFSILKDVPKTLVYRLSRYINEKAGRELIPENSITKPPSAELRPGQLDRDSLPDYDTLDAILQRYVENHMSCDEIVADGFHEAVVKKVIRLVDNNEYKRRQAAPGIKITPRAFGRDRRMPIVNRYRGLDEQS
ncbi:MAG: NAD+ synthase [Deltaproteobacteria bacterium]|nr:NAD+ synthase [Deltaproteobacteria bacterium]